MAASAGPYPWRIPFIFAVTFIIHYLDRNAIAYALPKIAQERDWTDQQLGDWGQYLLGAFFLTFGLSQIAFSGAAERFGAKRSIIAAIIGFSCVSMAVGPLGGSLAMLIALRLLLGLAEFVHVPMMGVITARKFPREMRATANSIWNVGLVIATALGSAILVPIMSAFGWRTAFVIIGVSGLLIGAPLVVAFVDDKGTSLADAEGTGGSVSASAGLLVVCRDRRSQRVCWIWHPRMVADLFRPRQGHRFRRSRLASNHRLHRRGDRHFAYRADWRSLEQTDSLASLGLLSASALLCLAISAQSLSPLVALFGLAVFCQSAYQAQEHATVQNLAGDTEVGAATGIYNGTSLVIGGVVGSMVPGAVVSATGNFNAALFVIAGAAAIGGLLAGLLAIRSGELNT